MFIGSSEENLNHEKFHLLDRTQACQQATTHQRPSVPFVPLDEGRVLGILFSETKRRFGDDGASDGESDEEWPITIPFSPEEHGPRIELPPSHFFVLAFSTRSLSLSLSLQLDSSLRLAFSH
uniref:Uncharacterized protein n=1 Tax=Opuntia streptacantha TaxID=393608 RepID=A0A7C8YY68_OPUST